MSATIETRNPATGEPLATVEATSVEQLREVVARASAAQPA